MSLHQDPHRQRRPWWQILLLALPTLIALLFFLVMTQYYDDIALVHLKKRFTYPDSKFMDIEGMQVHYRVRSTGKPLLLLHGTGASMQTWDPWINELADDFEIITLDLPAFGLTGPNPKHDYSIVMYVRVVDVLMRKLKIDSFAIAGNSLGGLIAWKYAAEHPSKVTDLVLIDAAGFPRNQPLPLAMRLAKDPIVGKVMLKITPMSLLVKSLKEVYSDDSKVTPDLIDRYFSLLRRPGNRQAYVDRVKQPLAIDTRQLSGLKMPVLIEWGGEDAWIPVGDATKFKQAIPQAEVKIYPKAGHVPMEEIPTITAGDAKAFLLRKE
jgi:pimeloyl-ACP methyl ester carboxylesterase